MEQIYEDISCYEAKDLLEKIESGNVVFLKHDPDIFMANGGHTEFGKDNIDFYIFSYGQNWRDQERTYKSKEKMLELLKKAIDNVQADFDKYGYDTEDTNACYITIEEEDFDPYRNEKMSKLLLTNEEMRLLADVKKYLREFEERFYLDDDILDAIDDITNYIDNEIV